MARCPAGHESQASDYCDTCGLVIGGEAAAAPAPLAAASASAAPGGAAASAVAEPGAPSGSRCPECLAERNGRFCEECGYDFDLAEAIPEAVLTPGVPAAEPEGTAGAESGATAGPGSGEGLDLEAELARAEAEAAPVPEAGTVPDAAVAATAAPAIGTTATAAPATGTTAAATPTGTPATGTATTVPSAVAEPLTGDPVAELPVVTPSVTLAALGGAGITAEELSLVVDADPEYYAAQVERGDIVESEFPFPKYPYERRFSFADGPVRIGRASASRGLSPEIDLTGPPLDPAVSHLHAQLLRHDEGWVVVDLGSANGTRLNDAEEPLEAETEIPIKQGDRIHLGVWTTITVL